MRGSSKLATLLIAAATLALVGCTQSLDTPAGSVNQAAITGNVAVSSPDSQALENSSDALTRQNQQDNLALASSDDMPFVRSQPQTVPPFPIVLNHFVQAYVRRFVEAPAGLERSFRRSRPYLSQMVAMFRNQGLPRDLIYLSFAESGFTSNGAGPWQFSRATARRFGLRINRWVDERRDPIKSTRAAARYLSLLRSEADDNWRLTLVAWNAGAGVLGHYMDLRDASYARLMAHLPRCTRELMNRFMAVALIARHATEYGIRPVNYTAPPPYHTIRVRGGTTLRHAAQIAHTSVFEIRKLNPEFLRDRVPPYVESYNVRVPGNELEASLSDSF